MAMIIISYGIIAINNNNISYPFVLTINQVRVVLQV